MLGKMPALAMPIALSALLHLTLGESAVDKILSLVQIEAVLRPLLEGLLGREDVCRRLREAFRRAEERLREKETDPELRQVLAMFSMADLPSVEEAVAACRAYPDAEAVRKALRQAIQTAAPRLSPEAVERAVARYLEEVERELSKEQEFLGPILLGRLGRIERLLGDLAAAQAQDRARLEALLALVREVRDGLRGAAGEATLRPLIEELAAALNRLMERLAAGREPTPAPAGEGVADLEGVM
jgi:uncharacterized protein (UPF0147 family)